MITEKDIGRKVIVNVVSNGHSFINLKGKIVDVRAGCSPRPRIGVEFDDGSSHKNFHSCQGNGKTGNCWYVYEDMITFADDFQYEYFTGLPQDLERAKKYIGKNMEFSDNGKRWMKGLFKTINDAKPLNPYCVYLREDDGFYLYCRTCPETFKPEKQYIELPAGKLPAPERVKPNIDDDYYIVDPPISKGFSIFTWKDDGFDREQFKNGIWLKESDIQEVVAWWRKTLGQN